jgi:hypothetical protein
VHYDAITHALKRASIGASGFGAIESCVKKGERGACRGLRTLWREREKNRLGGPAEFDPATKRHSIRISSVKINNTPLPFEENCPIINSFGQSINVFGRARD